MSYKLLQLNTEHGRHWEAQENYLRANHYDIIQFQEVAGGRLGLGGKQHDGFARFSDLLTGYWGQMVFSRQDKNPKNYSGNATFIDKTKFKVVDHKEIIMCSNGEGGFNVEKFNSSADMINRRSALLVALEAGTHRLNVINTHMLWDPTPHDTADKIGSAEVLLEAVKKITSELILSGDFNVNPETQTAGMFEAVGVNLTSKYAIVSTIDDTLHTRIAEISADHPQGVACDQVFVSRGIKVHDFGIIPEHLSDHRGLFLEFDFT